MLVRESVKASYGCARSSSFAPPQSSLRTMFRRTVRSLLRPRSTPPVYSSIPAAFRFGSRLRLPRPPVTDCRSAGFGVYGIVPVQRYVDVRVAAGLTSLATGPLDALTPEPAAA